MEEKGGVVGNISPRDEGSKPGGSRASRIHDSALVGSQLPPAAPRAANIIKQFGCEGVVMLCSTPFWLLVAASQHFKIK